MCQFRCLRWEWSCCAIESFLHCILACMGVVNGGIMTVEHKCWLCSCISYMAAIKHRAHWFKSTQYPRQNDVAHHYSHLHSSSWLSLTRYHDSADSMVLLRLPADFALLQSLSSFTCLLELSDLNSSFCLSSSCLHTHVQFTHICSAFFVEFIRNFTCPF